MLLDFLLCGIVFVGMVLGPGLIIVEKLSLQPEEKFVAGVGCSLVVIYLFGWLVYTSGLPATVLRIAPVLAAVSLMINRSTLRELLRSERVRQLVIGQVSISSWCIGLLSLVSVYSGGRLVADWFGHWQRALFFLYHWPRDIRFNGFDPLPSRPPLANVANTVFLRATLIDFSHYQFFSTLFSSLCFLPAGLLAQRLSAKTDPHSSRRVIAILAVLFMANPLFAEHTTYAWTKLPSAFFVLTGLYFFLRALDDDRPACAGVLAGGSLAAGILTHYSAVPYALLLATGWVWLSWPERNAAFWRSTIKAGAAGVFLLATWFGWALAIYGAGTFLSNTTVTDQAPTFLAQLKTIALNLRDSIVPHFLGGADFSVFIQNSRWGWWRDWFFQLYQGNVFFVFGSLAWVGFIPLVLNWRNLWATRFSAFWLSFVGGAVVLGIAVHGGREPTGLAYICLQPLALLGLTFLAGRWEAQNRFVQGLIIGGAALDLICGIILQFSVESGAMDRWFAPFLTWDETVRTYSPLAQLNFRVKADAGWIFLGDLMLGYRRWIVGGLSILFFAGVTLIRRSTVARSK